MKELFEAINTRVKEPYWGFFLLSFIAFNWRGLFLLCFASGTAQEKIVLFDSETTLWSILLLPIFTSILILLITPWLKFLFGLASRLAYEKLNLQELVREHRYITERNKLEKQRAIELANKEKELIDQAKRDVDIEKIENSNVKDSLKREIEQLRKERNEIIKNVEVNVSTHNDSNLNEFEKDILRYLFYDKDNFIKKGRNIQLGQFFHLKNEYIYKGKDTRNYLKYEEAIKFLLDKKFIYDLAGEGRVFELTDLGHDFIRKSEHI